MFTDMFGDDSIGVSLHAVQVPCQQIQEILQSVEYLRNSTPPLVDFTPLISILRIQGVTQCVQQILKSTSIELHMTHETIEH